MLRNIQDHENLKKNLEHMKALTILGCSMKSLEVASTIRREYPQIDLYVIDENDESALESQFGESICQTFIKKHVNHGVKFLFKDKIKEFDVEEDHIHNIHFNSGINIQTDGVLCFPNNF